MNQRFLTIFERFLFEKETEKQNTLFRSRDFSLLFQALLTYSVRLLDLLQSYLKLKANLLSRNLLREKSFDFRPQYNSSVVLSKKAFSKSNPAVHDNSCVCFTHSLVCFTHFPFLFTHLVSGDDNNFQKAVLRFVTNHWTKETTHCHALH